MISYIMIRALLKRPRNSLLYFIWTSFEINQSLTFKYFFKLYENFELDIMEKRGWTDDGGYGWGGVLRVDIPFDFAPIDYKSLPTSFVKVSLYHELFSLFYRQCFNYEAAEETLALV